MAAALLSAFLAVLYVLDACDLVPAELRMAGPPAQLAVYGLVAAAAFASACAPAAWRRAILLVAAVAAAPIALGAWSLAWLGFAALVVAVARAAVPLLARVAICVAAWACLPIARYAWLNADAQAATILLAIVWVGQLYAALYLLVEREREPPAQRPTAVADAFYLLAPPRLVVPFFQPISPRQLARCERANPRPRMLGRAAALAAYAAALAVLANLLVEAAPAIASRPVAIAVRFCAFYAHATCKIFTAVAMFRLLGFYLPPGFRLPFLSQSFAEFFRRYNYYVRDAVLSLFYYPLLGRLRHHLPPRGATIASAYIGIIVGSFLLHDLLVPMATAIEPSSTIGYFLDPLRLAGMIALWTLIIVPTAGIAPRRQPPRSRTRTVLGIAAFNVVYFALWYAQYVGRGH